MRLKKYKEERDSWPPIKTTSYVSLALVHQKELQTRQETTSTICLRIKGDIHKIPHTIDAKKLTDITKIFDPLLGRAPNSILIEGHAGIGKTTLVKEICIEWSEGKLLTSDKLVLLLLLRDPNVQKITDEHKLIEHFTNYSTTELYKEIFKNHGANITLIIDGFDELSSELRLDSFFMKLIEKKSLPRARIVVTSRPSASACLHLIVDRRIEVLGFEQSSKNQYVTEALQDSPTKLVKLQKHFQQYPNIDAMCYIPLIMSIIVYLCMCQPDELPPTATKMYACFILHTVCHYLKRVGKITEDTTISTLEQFPPVVYEALQQLEKIAFDGLVQDKIVFTAKELPVLCKDDPTCCGLLQSTECYSAEEIGTPIQSFNFLHLGIQEYFAAKYVTTLPEDKVHALLKKSFIVTDDEGKPHSDSNSIRLSNMWILYCGITSGQCKTLRNYLNLNFLEYNNGDSNDDEDNDDEEAEMLPSLSNSDDGKVLSSLILHSNPQNQQTSTAFFSPLATLDFTQPLVAYSDDDDNEMLFSLPNLYSNPQNQQINPTVSFPLTASMMFDPPQPLLIDDVLPSLSDVLKYPLTVLYLFQCFQEAQDDVLCKTLSKSFKYDVIDIKDHRLLPHQVVSLGFFLSKSNRKWKKLNLCECHIGDHGMSIMHQYLSGDKMNKQEISEIDLSYNDLTGISSQFIADIFSYLQPHTVWLQNNNITNVRGITSAVIATRTIKVLNIRSNCLIVQETVDMMTSLENLDISYNKIGDHEAELLSEGISNTKTLRVLRIDKNNIGPSGTAAIGNALANNTSLVELYMDNNKVGQDGAMAIAKAITINKTLNTLSLCGDDIMDKESAMMIMKSLHCNNTITRLHLPIGLRDDHEINGEVIKINNRRKECNAQALLINRLPYPR